MTDLSVVIPVYNVAPYLRQCIDSVLAQQIPNSEIILVDDGSTDESGAICDEYQNKSNYVKVIHKENGGLSSARNAGIEVSSGQYIIFLDSDDWWNPDVRVYDLIEYGKKNENVEMVLFSSLEYFEGKGVFARIEHRQLTSIRTDSAKNYYHDLLQNGNLEVSACTKLLKKEFIVNNQLYFKPGILGEDNEWMIRVLRSLSNVAILDIPVCIVRRGRVGSITSTIGKRNISDLLNIVIDSLNYCNGMENEIKELELDFCSYLWFCALGLSQRLSKMDFLSLKSQFLSCSTVCKYSSSPKTKLAYLAVRMAGINNTRCVFGAYIWVKNRTTILFERVKS